MLFQIPDRDGKPFSDKYQRIIHAAIRVFSRQGFFYAKVADVAKAAEVADGTIYLYFKNKDDLLVTIFEHSMDFFFQQTSRELDLLKGPAEKLEKFISLHLTAMQKNQDLAQVMQVELRSSTKFIKEYRAEKFFEYLRLIEDIIMEGRDQGVFCEGLYPQILKRAIFGAIDELALEWLLMKRKRYSLQEAVAQLSQMILNGLKNGKGA